MEEGILHQVDDAFVKQIHKKVLQQNISKDRERKKLTKYAKLSAIGDEEKKTSSEKVINNKSNNVSVVLEETEREKKIRMGEMTPFGTFVMFKTTEA